MPQKKYGWRVAGFVLKGLLALLIVSIIGILAFRIIDSKIVPSKVKTLTPNEKLCEVIRNMTATSPFIIKIKENTPERTKITDTLPTRARYL